MPSPSGAARRRGWRSARGGASIRSGASSRRPTTGSGRSSCRPSRRGPRRRRSTRPRGAPARGTAPPPPAARGRGGSGVGAEPDGGGGRAREGGGGGLGPGSVNRHTEALYVAVLDLGLAYGVSTVFPYDGKDALDPGATIEIGTRADDRMELD